MPEPKRPLKVFLCHAHADRDPVRGLYARLTQDGVDAWFDKAKLLPGQDWELEIRKAVREADVVVVCLSKQFNQAGFRQKEVRLALDTAMEKPEGEIFIIPARLEECDNLESLRKWHEVDLFENDGYEMLANALKSQADKIGATLQVKRSRTSKSNAQPQKEKRDSKIATSSGGVDIGNGVSGSVVVAGNGNVINLNQSLLSNDVDDKEEIEIVENGQGKFTTKIKLQTKSLENVFAFLQNRLQAIYPKRQERIQTFDNYSDGIARKVTYSETLISPNRAGNKLIVKSNYHIMVFPGKIDKDVPEITHMHQLDAISFTGWETQTVFLEVEYFPNWDGVMKKIIFELYDLFGKHGKDR